MVPTLHAVRGERYKFIRCQGLWDTDELYDLKDDPAESRNLIDSPAHAGVHVDRAVLVTVVKPEQLAVAGPVRLPAGRRVSQPTPRLCPHQILPPVRALPGGFR